MNFMNRKMFQKGGASNTLGPYQIRDLKTIDPKTGQPIIYDIKPDFINQMGFSPYKILYDKDLEKGSEVQKILQQFKEKDAPGIGPFQAREDIGTNIADIGFRLARQFEPIVRSGIRGVGEITGIQSLKDAGGELSYGRIPEGEGRLGQPFGFQMGESVIPSDADRARFMLRGITEKDEPIVPDVSTASVVDNEFINEDMKARQPRFLMPPEDYKLQVNLENTEKILSAYSPEDQEVLRTFIDPNTNMLTTSPDELMMRPERTEPLSTEDPFNTTLNLSDLTESLESLSEERQNLENRFAEEDIQRPADIDVDEITNLLNDIQQPSINLDKTEADSLLETIDKFDGLSPDELKFEIDKTKFPGMTELDKNKAEVAAQVKEIKKEEEARIAAGEDSDPNKAPRSPAAKKLNEPGFFGSDRFLNFIRNVGAGLVESGQVGPGLALGAAKAAEERAARDIAADERKAEMDKLIAIEEKKAEIAERGGPETSLKKLLRTNAQEMNADYNEVISGSNTLNTINRVREIVLNEDTASVAAFIGEITEKVGVFFDIDGKPSKTGTKFEDLEPRTRAKVLLNNIKQANIREILGESGKTISNLDRQIIDQLVGSLTLGTNPNEVLETLDLTKRSVLTNIQAAQSRLQTNFTFAVQEGDYGLSLIENNDSLINYIATLRKDPSALPVGKDYSNKYADVTAQRRKITLAEE